MAIRDILNRQACTIEYVLHTHGIRVEVDGGKLSPRLAHFHLLLPAGLRLSQLSPLMPELADALGVSSCRLAQVEGEVYVEAPRPDPVPVRLLPLVQRVADVVPPATATLGLDTEGTPLLLRLNSPEVDPVIISGVPGAGKSSLLRGMALSMALHNSPDSLRLLLLDCNGDGAAFSGLENLPHLACPIACGPVDSLVSLRWALRMLSRRAHADADEELTFAEEDDTGDAPPFEGDHAGAPALVVLVDGADRLSSTGNRSASAEAAGALRRLLSAGSEHGVHLVLSTERPEELAGVNNSWGARITGRVASTEAARAASGAKGSGAQSLLGTGDFLITLNAELIRFQAAAVSPAELARAVDLIVACSQAYPQPQPQLQTAVEDTLPALPRRGTPQPRLISRAGSVE